MNLNKLAGLSCLLTLTATLSARAMMIAPPSVAQRVATADGVIVGKVISLEPKTVFATRFPGDKEKGEFVIAVVKVDEALVGVVGAKEVRVGFIAPPPPPPAPVPGAPILLRKPYRGPTLAVDQEACLYLTKHSTESFFTLPAYYDVVNKKDNPNFAKEIEWVKKAAKLLADPKTGFASKDAEDRFITAALLLSRYQRRVFGTVGEPKSEPISAEESKQILLALLDADWTNAGRDPQIARTSPQLFFSMLPNKPGWTQPKDYKQFPDEARKWLKANAETYRVTKIVSEK